MKVFVKQPLALPGSANKGVTRISVHPVVLPIKEISLGIEQIITKINKKKIMKKPQIKKR